MDAVVSVSPIVAISDVMDCDFIAVNLSPGRLRDVRLPQPVVSWFQCSPPAEDDPKSQEDGPPVFYPALG